MSSMFKTGRGRTLTVSEQSLRRAEAFLNKGPDGGGHEQVALDIPTSIGKDIKERADKVEASH